MAKTRQDQERYTNNNFGYEITSLGYEMIEPLGAKRPDWLRSAQGEESP